MKKIGLSMAVCLMVASLAHANSPTGRMDSGSANGVNAEILPETYTRDGDGSGLGISETSPAELDTANAPGDVDQRNMGETGASGAVGTATGTTDSIGRPHKGKSKKGLKAKTSTSTSTSTETHMHPMN